MSELVLRKLTEQDEAAFLKAIGSWDGDSGFLFVRDYKPGMRFADYVRLLDGYSRGENLQPGFVPDTSWFGFVGAEIVGRLAIRHSLTDFLRRIGGHIGYGVVPPHRRKGYATKMLRLSLPLARELGIESVLVTCDDDNLGSIGTIEVCGGVLEDVVDAGEGKPRKRRYWIATSP